MDSCSCSFNDPAPEYIQETPVSGTGVYKYLLCLLIPLLFIQSLRVATVLQAHPLGLIINRFITEQHREQGSIIEVTVHFNVETVLSAQL